MRSQQYVADDDVRFAFFLSLIDPNLSHRTFRFHTIWHYYYCYSVISNTHIRSCRARIVAGKWDIKWLLIVFELYTGPHAAQT